MKSRTDRSEYLGDYFKTSARVLEHIPRACGGDITRAAEMIADSIRNCGKLLLCGNGGSAADCQHVAAELMCRLTKRFERPAIPAIALTTDTSFLTAYSNDLGFDGAFKRQIEGLARPGDVVLGISTSGNSKNVLLAFEEARVRGAQTIALCGTSGEMKNVADIAICVPSNDTQQIQEAHLAIEHVLCSFIELELYPELAPV